MMKRYVLLDNDLIYDRTKLDKDKDWLIIRILEKIDKGETNNLAREIKLQSDNLIDLLEVGDCVECDYGLHNEIYAINNESELAYLKGDNTVVAIWKRNGDIMSRYTVRDD